MRQRNTIVLAGEAREQHAVAGEAITPGSLVELTSTGWKNHSTEGGPAQLAFARENRENQGASHAAGGIDDDIANGDAFTVVFPEQGAKVFAPCTGTIEAGDPVESAGDGTVQIHGSGTIVGWADADADTDVTPFRVAITVGGAGGNSA